MFELSSLIRRGPTFGVLASGHFPAFRRALTADPGALLAMDVLKDFTFLGTGVTDLGTEAAQGLGEVAVAGHILDRLETDFRTVVQDFHAFFPGLQVRFL